MNARRAAMAVCLAALAGCDRFGAASIDMAHPPRTKPGAWVETGALFGKPIKPFTFCDAGRPIFPPKAPECSEWRAVRQADGAIDFDSTCAKFGTTFRMHRHIVGDLTRAFTEDISSVDQAPGSPDDKLSAHMQSRYLGPCPPGMKVSKPNGG